MLELSRGSVSIRTKMGFGSAILAWFQRNRTSVRMAFALRLIAMAGGSIFSLVWYRLLLHAMGDLLLGLLQNFQALTTLGGAGDLGIGPALALKAGLMLGRGDESGLRKLLASARLLFLFMACVLGIGFVALSPWLTRGLNFGGVPGTGSIPLLFLYGGLSLLVFVLGGYFAGLNYAHGTVTWPILPTMLVTQVVAPFFQWRLALIHAPLWLQNTPFLIASIVTALMAWYMLKWSHPWLGNLLPVEFDRGQWKSLATSSGWVYLLRINNVIYLATDRLVIGAVIGYAIIPAYLANNKVCDLAATLILTAAGVSLPKMTQWSSSPHEGDRRRLLAGLDRLSTFEIVLACTAVFGYLAFNNLFIRLWLDKEHQVPLAWQVAFACNLAVTCGGNVGIQLSIRAGNRGLKMAGIAAVATGLLNLSLSVLSAKLGSIMGVAVATVIAQSIFSIYLGTITSRYFGNSSLRWAARCWLMPLAVTLMAAGLKKLFPDNSFFDLGLLSVCYFGLLLVVCRLAGLNREMLDNEISQVRAMLSRK